jgi:hypothetical protein
LKFRGFLVLGMVLVLGRMVSASIVVSDGAIQDASTGEYQYNVELEAGSVLKAGDGLVIDDFPGLITSGPNAPSLTTPGFTFNTVQSLTGNDLKAPSPSLNANPPGNHVDFAIALVGGTADDATINNVSVVYNGAAQLGPTADELGVLTLYSSLAGPGITLNADSASGSKDSSGSGGSAVYDSGSITVPVPEPTSLGVLGMVGMILGSRRRVGRSKA